MLYFEGIFLPLDNASKTEMDRQKINVTLLETIEIHFVIYWDLCSPTRFYALTYIISISCWVL